jgi:hypothetical protein
MSGREIVRKAGLPIKWWQNLENRRDVAWRFSWGHGTASNATNNAMRLAADGKLYPAMDCSWAG